MEHLNALASICESAERMPVASKPEIVEKMPTINPQTHILSPSEHLLRSYYNPTLPLLCSTPPHYLPTIATGSYLTPPITPASGQPPYVSTHQLQETSQDTSQQPNLTLSLQYASPATRPTNPVMRNIISYASYLQYLDETWPEKCSRRGSAVIRSSLYAQIADCLKGGASTARFRYWVRKSAFFLLEKQQPSGSYEMRIAVPFNPKSHGNNNKRKFSSSTSSKEYRLVAKLEEFLSLIGEYHNDTIGHYGIRKTYQMIQQDYTYLPRSAIAKFVQLCDVCSVRGKRVSRPREENSTRISRHIVEVEEEEEEEEGEEVDDNSIETTVMLLPTIPCPDGGEIEVTTESLSPSNSLEVEDSTISVTQQETEQTSELLTSSFVAEKETVTEITESLSNDNFELTQEEGALQSSSQEVNISNLEEDSDEETEETETVSDSSHQELYQQIHESVKHILEGLTWEEMLQVFSEASDTSIITSSSVLESMLRM